MSVRLKRCGAKNRPFYRVVAVDARKKRDGRVIETLGTYDPMVDPPAIRIEDGRLQHWIDRGAQPTATVRRLIRQNRREPAESQAES